MNHTAVGPFSFFCMHIIFMGILPKHSLCIIQHLRFETAFAGIHQNILYSYQLVICNHKVFFWHITTFAVLCSGSRSLLRSLYCSLYIWMVNDFTYSNTTQFLSKYTKPPAFPNLLYKMLTLRSLERYVPFPKSEV